MKRVYPRINLEGTDLLKRVGVIYSQILGDLLMKVDDGEGDYPKGFFHTSTNREMTPNYYHAMWSRDVGRGIMELCRAGLMEDAESAVEFILGRGFDCGDHYGRVLCNIHGEDAPPAVYEADGNVNLLMGFYTYWWFGGKQQDVAKRLLAHADPVFGWFERLGEECPYGFLLASQSELSGNPDCSTLIYAVYATYGAVGCLQAYARMAAESGDSERTKRYTALACKFTQTLLNDLVSKGGESNQETKTPVGVWLNGLRAEDGKAAEIGDFGPKFPIHRWTRQLPFVLDFDRNQTGADDKKADEVNGVSYEYIRDGMAEGYYFRKYGFVSCTCFSGMGGRHDDTMAGYGQNLFTQAALLQDDVNVYTKCIDGICRLAYDGDVVKPLTPDFNPWVMHECFTYENYEQGLDHTFGRAGDDSRMIMHNPGDEGNLVQSAETLKTFAIMAGVTSEGNRLCIHPRLPWECTKAQIVDFPAVTVDRRVARISYTFTANRWKNEYSLEIEGAQAFDEIDIRMGPLPRVLFNEKELQKEWQITRRHQASFASKTVKTNGETKISLVLTNEK